MTTLHKSSLYSATLNTSHLVILIAPRHSTLGGHGPSVFVECALPLATRGIRALLVAVGKTHSTGSAGPARSPRTLLPSPCWIAPHRTGRRSGQPDVATPRHCEEPVSCHAESAHRSGFRRAEQWRRHRADRGSCRC